MKYIAYIVCLFLTYSISFAQTQSPSTTQRCCELLSDNLIYPLGINSQINQLDIPAIETGLQKEGTEYRTMNIDTYGTVITAYPTNFMVGGVKMARIMFILNDAAKMIIYESEQSEDYVNVCETVSSILDECSITKDFTEGDAADISTFMISDSMGISVGELPAKHISMLYFMEMQNLNDFLNLQE